jgi:hypothetical protein
MLWVTTFSPARKSHKKTRAGRVVEYPRLLNSKCLISIHPTQIFFLIFEQKLTGVRLIRVEAIPSFDPYKMTRWGRTPPNSQVSLPV